jgi:ABC-type uncharacterized transport system permease subunit
MTEKAPLSSPEPPPITQPTSNAIEQEQVAYNVVTDLVTGVNVRGNDNKFQAIFVTVSVLLIAGLGAILAAINTQWNLPWYGGALIGSFLGLVLGILTSGIFLMIYRAVRHIQGKHD